MDVNCCPVCRASRYLQQATCDFTGLLLCSLGLEATIKEPLLQLWTFWQPFHFFCHENKSAAKGTLTWKLVLDDRPVVGFLVPDECWDELLVLVLVLSAEKATVQSCASEMTGPNIPIKHILTFTFRHLLACSTCSASCLRIFLIHHVSEQYWAINTHWYPILTSHFEVQAPKPR